MTPADRTALREALAKMTPGIWDEDWSDHHLTNADLTGIWFLSNAAPALLDALDRAEAEAEQLRCALAGCSVAAFGNTREALEEAQKLATDSYGYSASYADVLRAVEREIDNRERAEKAEAELEQAFREGWNEGWHSRSQMAECWPCETEVEAVAAWRERRAAEKGGAK